MAYDSELDLALERVTGAFGMEKKKMFGGTCYLEDKKMVCGTWKDNVILRLSETDGERALKEKKADVFDITGRPMKGWVMINKKYLSDALIRDWVEQARIHVKSIVKK